MIPPSENRPLACWEGRERYNEKIIPCLTVIFRTGGCSWNRCLMCGYRFERMEGASAEEILSSIVSQIRWVIENHPPASYEMVKIFTSGSFFDPDEVPPAAREAVAEAFRGKLLVIESRTEYVSQDIIEDFISGVDTGAWDCPLYIAMGLETTDDAIREKSIDKGLTFSDFKEASAETRRGGAGVKTYLMMKPPFITEREAVDDMHRSIRECSPYSDLISMNLCTVQKKTHVEYLWKRGAYRPPYLWSAVEALHSADRHVTCDPVGGGHMRGPHNCRKCDREIVSAISDYSLAGKKEILSEVMEKGCTCMEEWQFILREEEPYCMPLTR